MKTKGWKQVSAPPSDDVIERQGLWGQEAEVDGLIHDYWHQQGIFFRILQPNLSFFLFFTLTNCSCQALTSNQSSGLTDYSGDRRASSAHDLLCSFLLTNPAETWQVRNLHVPNLRLSYETNMRTKINQNTFFFGTKIKPDVSSSSSKYGS